jgi:putative glutamine amidotransferase
MRLVSALYDDSGPFHLLNGVNDFTSVSDVSELQDHDILLLHGGSDIHPSYYNKGRSSKSGAGNKPSHRDEIEWDLMTAAKARNIPIIGICRGAQFLCAMEGGTLFQHVDGHSGNHMVEVKDHKPFVTNSIHHQMMQPSGDFEIIAGLYNQAKLSHKYWDVEQQKDITIPSVEVEPEFVYYPKIRGFAIQWHPEMMHVDSPANLFTLNFINSNV